MTKTSTNLYHFVMGIHKLFSIKAAKSVTFDLLILEIKFLFFKNTVKNTQIQVNILPFS